MLSVIISNWSRTKTELLNTGRVTLTGDPAFFLFIHFATKGESKNYTAKVRIIFRSTKKKKGATFTGYAIPSKVK